MIQSSKKKKAQKKLKKESKQLECGNDTEKIYHEKCSPIQSGSFQTLRGKEKGIFTKESEDSSVPTEASLLKMWKIDRASILKAHWVGKLIACSNLPSTGANKCQTNSERPLALIKIHY